MKGRDVINWILENGLSEDDLNVDGTLSVERPGEEYCEYFGLSPDGRRSHEISLIEDGNVERAIDLLSRKIVKRL